MSDDENGQFDVNNIVVGPWHNSGVPPAPGDPPPLMVPQQPVGPSGAGPAHSAAPPMAVGPGAPAEAAQAPQMVPSMPLPQHQTMQVRDSDFAPIYARAAPMARPVPRPVRALAQAPAGTHPSYGHLLGMALLVPATAGLIGYKYGGLFGGLAGSLFGGAVVNAYRAVHFYKFGVPETDREARISATYAVIAGALGGVVWYKAAEKPAGHGYSRNQPESTVVPTKPVRQIVQDRSPCNIRPVLPPASE